MRGGEDAVGQRTQRLDPGASDPKDVSGKKRERGFGFRCNVCVFVLVLKTGIKKKIRGRQIE